MWYGYISDKQNNKYIITASYNNEVDALNALKESESRMLYHLSYSIKYMFMDYFYGREHGTVFTNDEISIPKKCLGVKITT